MAGKDGRAAHCRNLPLSDQGPGFAGQAARVLAALRPAACPIRAPNLAQLRSLTAIQGQPFPLHVTKLPSQSFKGLVFQAGHASSILVTRSSASLLVNSLFSLPKLFEHPDEKNNQEL
jgi:hypothetical protein